VDNDANLVRNYKVAGFTLHGLQAYLERSVYEGRGKQYINFIDLTHSQQVKLETFQNSLKFHKGVL